jgi:hypothetical protein
MSRYCFWLSTFGRLFEFWRCGPRATLFKFMKLTAYGIVMAYMGFLRFSDGVII